MTTLTVYADTADGRIESSDPVYVTARSGSNLGVSAGASPNSFGQSFETPTYFVREAFFNFDTSSIPAGDVIDTAVFSLYGSIDYSDTDFTAEVYLKDWGATLDTGDWVAGANLGAQTLLATFASAGFSVVAYNVFTSEVAFISNITKAGTTRVMVSSSRTRASTTPTGLELLSCVMSDAGANKPRLVVDYHASAATSNLDPMGVSGFFGS